MLKLLRNTKSRRPAFPVVLSPETRARLGTLTVEVADARAMAVATRAEVDRMLAEGTGGFGA